MTSSTNQPARHVTLKNGKAMGDGEPCYVIAEIGINHNGSLDLAKQIIDGAVHAGADCAKFQKRTPEICTPKSQWDKERDTPWGRMKYIDYRHKVEFGVDEYAEIDRYCKSKGIDWTASCWDEPSVTFMEQFNPPFYKAASASLTDWPLLKAMITTGRPLIISTGMSTQEEIDAAVKAIGLRNLLIAHSTSSYPCPPKELNLRMIQTLRAQFPTTPIGYSGHEVGLATTEAAVAFGAAFVERHVTVDRALWGSDQAASVEIVGLERMVRDIRNIEEAMGDGVKQVYESEMAKRESLRNTN